MKGAERLKGQPLQAPKLQLRAPLRLRCGVSGPGQAKKSYSNANFPTDPEGRTYHLGTKRGEVAPRVLSVGTTQRAKLLSQLLEPPSPEQPMIQHLSSRGFLTITGKYKGQLVSIVSTHMGMPNMDFVVRECRAVVDGQMAIIRLGTCGAVQPPAKLGNMLIASGGSIAIQRDPDAWLLSNGSSPPPYKYTLAVGPDQGLTALLVEEAALAVGADRVVQGLNASADSFYSSQGRTGGDFDDRNETLIAEACARYPDLISLEMETFQLLHLARCSKGSIKAIGMCIAIAERYTNVIEYRHLEEWELLGGQAALSALARVELDPTAGPTAGVTSSGAAAAAARTAAQSVEVRG